MTSYYSLLALLMVLSLVDHALGALTMKPQIVDPIHVAPSTSNPQQPIDITGSSNETPIRANTTVYTGGAAASGFKWGGYYSSTNGSYSLRVLDNNINSYGILLTQCWQGGQYWYTIFSSSGTNAPDQCVNLSGKNAVISFQNNCATNLNNPATNATTFNIRALLRSNATSAWYISDSIPIVNPTGTTLTYYFPVYGLKWYAVDAAVNTNLNLLVGADEMALTYSTSAAAPDFTKVDGGGFFFDNVNTVATMNNYAGVQNYKMGGLTWAASNTSVSPNLKAICSPCYPGDTGSLVLTPASGAVGAQLSGTITISSALAAIPITINSASIAGISASEFIATGLPTAGTVVGGSGAASIPVNVSWTPSAPDNMESSASLRLAITTYLGNSTVDIPIKGRDLVKGTIYETFNQAVGGSAQTNNPMAGQRTTYPNEYPIIMRPPTYGVGSSGFVWGGYTVATTGNNAAGTNENRDMIGISGARLTFYAPTTNDANASGCYHGCYGYGLFDTMGTKGGNPAGLFIDRAINLNRFYFYCDLIPNGAKVRWLIRDDNGNWFLSQTVTAMQSAWANNWTFVDIGGFTWYQVDTNAQNYMNGIAAALGSGASTAGNVTAQVAIAEPSTLTTAVPNTTNVTGAGVYIEQGNTDPSNTPLCFPDLNLIATATNGDTLATSQTTVKESIPVPNRRVALAGITLSEKGTESALSGVDVTVSPNTTGIQNLILVQDNNGNGMADYSEPELTQNTLDANGTTANLTIRNSFYMTKLNSPQKLALVGVFDDSASSKTYSFSIPASGWKWDTDLGGTDTIQSTPAAIAASVAIQKLTFPATGTLFENQAFSESWNGAAAMVLNTTANGNISADNAWTYTWTNTGGNEANAQLAAKNGSMAVGAEVKDLTVEPRYDGGIRFDSNSAFLYQFDEAHTAVAKVSFELNITSTTSIGSAAHLSGRVINANANVILRLAANNNSDALNFTFYPLIDSWQYVFGIQNYVSGVNYLNQYAPKNILGYSNAPGTGIFKFNVWLAPYSDTATLARVEMTETSSAKSLTWMTVVDGKVPNFKYVRVAFGAYPNTYIDNIVLTSYTNVVNPVKHWSIFD